MRGIFVIVADRTQAKLYEFLGFESGLNLIKEMNNPKGRLKDGEIGTDKPGRSFESTVVGRHALAEKDSLREQVLERFLMDFAEQINRDIIQIPNADLILIADPKVLGRLKLALGDKMMKSVKATLPKNFVQLKERDLLEVITPLIAPPSLFLQAAS